MEIIENFLYISLYIWGVFILLSGGFYLLSTSVFENNYGTLKIFKKFPASSQVRLEIKNSIISLGVLNLQAWFLYLLFENGWTSLSADIPDWWLSYLRCNFL